MEYNTTIGVDVSDKTSKIGKVYNAVSQIGKVSCRSGESRFEERRTGNGKGGKSEGIRNDP